MANEPVEIVDQTPASAPKKIRRMQIGANVVAQVVFILLIATFVNYLGLQHYRRWDFSRDQKYSLSDKTKRFLGTIKDKVRITNFFPPSTEVSADVQSLLTEYQYAAKGKIDVENVDPQRNLSRAKEVLDKYHVVTDEPLLVIDYGGKNKTVKASEMAEIDRSGMQFGEGPRNAAFKGEQAVTSAMMDLVEGKKNTIGYIIGHKEPPITESSPAGLLGEPQAPSSPISTLRTFIENENIKFKELNLFNEPQIPADINMVMLTGPQYDLSDREMKLLRDFWDKQGRLLILLDPSAKTPKLFAWLNELGVKANDDRLMVFIRTGIQEVAITQDVQATFLGNSPVTERLADAQILLSGGCCSLTLEPDRVRPASIHLQPLIQAEKGYFTEKDYTSRDEAKFQNDAKNAPSSPITIGVSVERGGAGDTHVQMNSARMVLVSNSTFIDDNALTQDQQALDFVSGASNWLLSREQLIGIAPKVPKPLTFSLSDDAMSNVRWVILVLIPLIPAIIGATVWWQRRV